MTIMYVLYKKVYFESKNTKIRNMVRFFQLSLSGYHHKKNVFLIVSIFECSIFIVQRSQNDYAANKKLKKLQD